MKNGCKAAMCCCCLAARAWTRKRRKAACCCNICRLASTVVDRLQNAEIAAQVRPLANANAADVVSIDVCIGMVEPQPVHVRGAVNHAAHQPRMVTELRHHVAIRICCDRGLVCVAPHIISLGVRCGVARACQCDMAMPRSCAVSARLASLQCRG